MMQRVFQVDVINPISEQKFDVVCEAGVKLVEQLRELLSASGLGPEEAANVLAMAAGGVLQGLPSVKPSEFMEAAYISSQMWRRDPDGGLNGVVFDPPHKRPGFVPVERERGEEN